MTKFLTIIFTSILLTLSLISPITQAQGVDSQVLTIGKQLKVLCPQIDAVKAQDEINLLKDKSIEKTNQYLNQLANDCRKEDIDKYFKNTDDVKAYEAVYQFMQVISPLQKETNSNLQSAKSLLPIILYPLQITEILQPDSWLCLPNITGINFIEKIQLKDKMLDLTCSHPLASVISYKDIGAIIFGSLFVIWFMIMTVIIVVKMLFNNQKHNPESNWKLFVDLVTPLIQKALIGVIMSILFVVLFNAYNIGAKLLVHYADSSNSSFCGNQSNIKCLAGTLIQVEQRKLLVTTKADSLPSKGRTSKGWLGIFPEVATWKSWEQQAKDFFTWFVYLGTYTVIACILLYLSLGFMAIQLMTWIKIVILFIANQLMLYTSANPVKNFKEMIYRFQSSFIHLMTLRGVITLIILCFSLFNEYTVSIGLIVGFSIIMFKGANLYDYVLVHLGFDKKSSQKFINSFAEIKANSFKRTDVAKKTIEVGVEAVNTSKQFIQTQINEPLDKVKAIKKAGLNITNKFVPLNVKTYLNDKIQNIKNKTKAPEKVAKIKK